jgi:RsmE family RNA methyltransferase
MNIILLTEDDFVGVGHAVLSDRRLQHIRTVLDTEPGQMLKVGMVNGKLGRGRVRHLDQSRAELDVFFEQDPPPPQEISLLLALPRPKALRRILQAITSLGIKKIILLNSYRVEKSYWQSPLLAGPALREQLLLGLEQACDTLLPEVLLRPRFKPFVEDELRELAGDATCLVAHPGASSPCPVNLPGPVFLAIGPEGGFIPYEIERLRLAGFHDVHQGERILRVETAIPALVGRLLPI